MFGFKGLAKIKKFLNVGQGEPPVKEPTSYPTIKKYLEGRQGPVVNSLRDGLPKRKTNP